MLLLNFYEEHHGAHDSHDYGDGDDGDGCRSRGGDALKSAPIKAKGISVLSFFIIIITILIIILLSW